MLNEIKNKKLLREQIETLKRSILKSKVFLPVTVSKFVFLCGANKIDKSISERREAIIEFSKKHLSHTQFFLAEKIFKTLQKEGHKENILDVEHHISKFADNIVIILESPSAFAELGAFAHKELREKLIIINDKQYVSEESFINLGPIKAIEEHSGKHKIIHYKMSSDGIKRRDAIGDVFDPLYKLLKDPIKGRASAVKIESCDPSKTFDKYSAMFIHDLIYFTGPIFPKELVEVLKIIFGDNSFDLKKHLAILAAFESLSRGEIDSGKEKGNIYKSKIGNTYYKYNFDTNKIISTFRNYMLKGYPERIYEY